MNDLYCANVEIWTLCIKHDRKLPDTFKIHILKGGAEGFFLGFFHINIGLKSCCQSLCPHRWSLSEAAGVGRLRSGGGGECVCVCVWLKGTLQFNLWPPLRTFTETIILITVRSLFSSGGLNLSTFTQVHIFRYLSLVFSCQPLLHLHHISDRDIVLLTSLCTSET